jgi:hypothetical protein
MSFSRYPKYKDSGVEWLGQVPELRANGPALFQPGATPQGRGGNAVRAESPAQPCAGGSPFQGLRLPDADTQGVALGWHGTRRWRWKGGAA